MLALLQSVDKSLAFMVPYVPIDRHIERRREEYYHVLRRCSKGKFSTDARAYAYEPLLVFMLKCIKASFADFEFYRSRYSSLINLSIAASKVLECFRDRPELRLQTKSIVDLTAMPRPTVVASLKKLLTAGFTLWSKGRNILSVNILVFLSKFMERENSGNLSFGSQMPSFLLPNASSEGVIDSKKFFAGTIAQVVIFACNHCPYVQGAIAALHALAKLCYDSNIGLVVISSNDAAKYPDDSFAKMQEFAKSRDITWPYLYDKSQDIARRFDAACTPEAYLFTRDRGLIYHGAVIDRTLLNKELNPGNLSSRYLESFIHGLLQDANILPQFVRPVGCSIKW